MSTHPNPTTRTRRPATGDVWTIERIRALGATTTLPVAASVLGISRSQAYRLAAANGFPTPLIRAGSRIIVPTIALLRLVDPDPAPGDRRLDSGHASSVDATDTSPADYPRYRWRPGPEHPGDDE
jgi:hypothetical protein